MLVCTSAGLQVVDTATDRVVRTLPDLPGGEVAVSFDGKRAYVSSSNFGTRSPSDLHGVAEDHHGGP